MYKKIIVCLLTLLLSWPLFVLAEEEKEAVGPRIGQVGRQIKSEVKEGFRQTKQAGKEVGLEVKEDSLSAWQKTRHGFKKFWKDIKDGFDDGA